MKLMSFSMTTEAFKRREKTVTRRLGWWNLKPGELLQGVEQAQGLRKGEHVKRLHVIRVTDVRQEPLYELPAHGPDECAREGFPELTPAEFVEMFCKANRCGPGATVNRVEFEYVDAAPC